MAAQIPLALLSLACIGLLYSALWLMLRGRTLFRRLAGVALALLLFRWGLVWQWTQSISSLAQ